MTTSLTPLGDPPADPDAPLVVVFPHAGGSPRFFAHWAGLVPGARLLGVTYPGRDTRLDETHRDNPHGDDLPGLAHAVADDLRDELPGRGAPILVGHSMGAWVAYETARALETSGRETRVVASGQNPPSRPAGTALHRGTDDELVADVVRQNPDSAPLWEEPELRALFLPAVREDYRLLETYPGGGEPVTDVLACAGDDDGEVDRDGLQHWNRVSRTARDPVLCRGGHFYLAAPDRQLPALLVRHHLAPASTEIGGAR